MPRLAALMVLLAAPAAGAQVIPDAFVDSQENYADRAQQILNDRYRVFLAGTYAESTVGPSVGADGLVGTIASEAGYRFRNGHSLSVRTTVQTPLAGVSPAGRVAAGTPFGNDPERSDATSVSAGAQLSLALGGLAPQSVLARRSELGIGISSTLVGPLAVGAVELAPRVFLPLAPGFSVPLGVRVGQEFGDGARGPFVAVSVGIRRNWVDRARIVLNRDASASPAGDAAKPVSGTGPPHRASPAGRGHQAVRR